MIESDQQRSPADIQFALEVGDRFGRRLDNWPRFGFRPLRFSSLRERLGVAQSLLQDLVRQVQLRYSDSPHLGDRFLQRDDVSLDLVSSLDGALRLLAFSRQAGLDGVPVLILESGAFDFFPIFDLFNERARSSVSVRETERLDSVRAGSDFNYLRFWAKEVFHRSEGVDAWGYREATTGYFTLFADSLRSIMNIFKSNNVLSVDFTVNSVNRDYRLEYFPQYEFSPEVFGATLSTPVTDRINIGCYGFQGRRDQQIKRDRAFHFAGPDRTSTVTRDF